MPIDWRQIIPKDAQVVVRLLFNRLTDLEPVKRTYSSDTIINYYWDLLKTYNVQTYTK